MASLVYTLISLSMQCSVRREISPCTCATNEILSNTVDVSCEGVGSFNQVFDALQNKFQSNLNIHLKIAYSQLEDLETRSFQDINANIKNLRLNNDALSVIPESSFRNLSSVEFLSLSENSIEEIPKHIFNHMPNIATLDLGKQLIRKIGIEDFKALKYLHTLVLVSNQIKILEQDSIPKGLTCLHLGKNFISSLNGTVRELRNLTILFLNENNLTTIENELPIGSNTLKMILAHSNRLEYLPADLRTFNSLDSLYFYNNQLKTIGGNLKHGRYIENLYFHHNHIAYLAQDEFEHCENVEILDMAYNHLTGLNGSLAPLKNVRRANFSHNFLNELTLNEISGLRALQVLDLSYNRIEKLSGALIVENSIEPGSFIFELRLEHNFLKSLDGAMLGLNKLKILNLAHNFLRYISPEDLIGLVELEILDISHNNLQTLAETSKTFLPKLEKLHASNNNLTKLEKDFHGLPVLCLADLSYNQIHSISPELVTKTRCVNHGVMNKLEILLQENPVLCDDEKTELFAKMEAQEARLLGGAHCIVPKKDLSPAIIEKSDVYTQTQPELPSIIINKEIPQETIPSIVILPAPLLIQQLSTGGVQSSLPSSATTTSTPIVPEPTEEIESINSTSAIDLSTTEKIEIINNSNSITTKSGLISFTLPLEEEPLLINDSIIVMETPNNLDNMIISDNSDSNIVPIDNASEVLVNDSVIVDKSTILVSQPLATTSTTITPPIIQQINSEELDNSVHTVYSSIPILKSSANGDDNERTQQLIEPEEPPEVVHQHDSNV